MSHFYFPKCVWVLPTCQAMLPQISNWCPVIDLGSNTVYPATVWDPSLPKITAPFSQDCPNISPEDVSWKYKSGDPYSWRSYKSNSQNHLLDFYPTRYTHRIQGNNSPTTVTVDRTQVRKTSHLWEVLLSKGSYLDKVWGKGTELPSPPWYTSICSEIQKFSKFCLLGGFWYPHPVVIIDYVIGHWWVSQLSATLPPMS